LITEEDRDLVIKKIFPTILNENFPEASDAVMVDPLLIGDYMTANPAD